MIWIQGGGEAYGSICVFRIFRIQHARLRSGRHGNPEPLWIIVILANFCFGLWNVYSNARQEKRQTAYDQRQQQLIAMLSELREEIGGSD